MKLLLIPILILFLNVSSLAQVALLRSNDQSNWFPFVPKNILNNGVVGMADWLDAPAGKHGFLQNKGDKLVFEDGKTIKLWGTNVCSNMPYVNAEKADSFVAFIGKYGVNAVRFHKFTASAYNGDQSTELDPVKFKRFDYFQSKLREKGIYYGWSHIYGQRVLPGDSSKMLAYSEIRNLKYPWSHLNGTTSSLVNFAPDLQDINIALTVNMLNHINPFTGLRYADDPALAFVEFQNEDDIFWGAIEKSLEQAPTYRAMLCNQFSKWLKLKYGSQAELEKAWGVKNIPAGESLEKENIYPKPSHSLFSWEYEATTKEGRTMATHILDKMRFLYETQLAFYKKFEDAVRATGYKGVLVGSCWQAGSGPAHLYNLHTDYEVGLIDRHNYFGGQGGHSLVKGPVKNTSMLTVPGSGLLSTGLQQVSDRPFSLSEWMSLVPTEWTAEAAPLIAVYGMGLQGWDASFSFATDLPRFSRLLESEKHGVYNATSPLHFGLYPALARMIYRNDVAESSVLATRNVNVPALETGKLGFLEIVKQGYDDKTFTGTVKPEMLAIGRFPVKFTEFYQKTIMPEMTKYWNSDSKTVKSATDELCWKYGEQPYVTVNTASTIGVVGFAQNQQLELGDWKIRIENPFAVILVTNLSKEGTLKNADKILITAIARGRNSGMEYEYPEGKTILKETGKAPLLLEPVKATISNKKIKKYSVKVLDQDGFMTQTGVPVKNSSFVIDGSKYKTIYYLIVRK